MPPSKHAAATVREVGEQQDDTRGDDAGGRREVNRAVLERAISLIGTGEYAALGDLYTDDYVLDLPYSDPPKRLEGRREIVGIGEAVIENPDIEVTAGGGLLCSLFGAAGGALTDSFLQPFADTVNQLVDDLRDDLIGVEICE